jgi:thiosulfate dehydrogenase [quinone] large subunit
LLGPWSSAGYLRAATGPFADAFHRMAGSSWLPAIDHIVAVGLVLVGLSLVLGLFTQAGCLGALVLLAMFYLAQIPTRGLHDPGSEGAYLFVNKNLVEAAAVFALFAFRTGRIAGLDRLRRRPAPVRPRVEEAA